MSLNQRITVIPGDGIGPSIVDSAIRILDALQCGLDYEYVVAGTSALDKGEDLIPHDTLKSIRTNKVALKGPLTTPVGKGFTSVNVTLRRTFDLYANYRPVISFPGTKSRYDNIDLVIIRENTEGMYSGEGHIVDEDGERAEAHSVITRKGSDRIVRFAFDMAVQQGRKKVAVVHKANILKSTSGLFLSTARDIAAEYPQIEMKEYIVDNCCMQLVMDPYQFDVIVTTNLFGDILSDLCAGLVGGLGLAPGANIGRDLAIFEAVHGSAPDIAGKNIANPTSMLLSTALMLDHLKQHDKAQKIRTIITEVMQHKEKCTGDLGGPASTTEFTDALIERI